MAPQEGLNGVIPEEEEIIFRSKLPDIDIPNDLLLHQYVFQKLPEVSSKPCLINGATNEVLTYSQVELTARRIGAGLRTLGIKQRDVIMVLLPNCPEFALAFLGASYAGATATTANPFYTPAEISKQVKGSNSRIIITHSAYVEKVKDHRNDGVLIVCVGPETEIPEGFLKFTELTRSAESDSIQEEGDLSPDDVVALPYSSGTTGLPKGVMVTHRGLVTSIAQKVDGENPNMYIHDGDVILCMLPMFHIYALDAILLSGIRAGAAILIMPKYEFESLLELIQRHRVTVAPIAPPVVLEIAKSEVTERYDLSSVRAVISGAATLRKELEVAMPSKFPNARFGQGYGMTESGTLTNSLAFAKEPFEAKLGSCGTVVRNAEMKIVDPTTGVSLNRNQPGEICIRGGQLMKGYVNDPDATAETIDKRGWLHTGDIGYIDEDDELFIVDRIKELIKYKGYQVAPAELETLLTAHSDITDAAVVGLKDENAGEIPVAFVVRSKESELTEDDIKLYVSEQVVFYKRIKKVFFVDAIPKAPSGKILRKHLRARLQSERPN